MENPNTRIRLQRHHTTTTTSSTIPSTLRRRATVLQSRLPMKSNPYVGSFRHAPPATTVTSSANTSTTTTTSTSTYTPTTDATEPAAPRRRSSSCGSVAESFWTSQFHIPVTLPRKSSPYIGWFRHAPPSRFSSCRHNEFLRWEDGCCHSINNNNNKWYSSLPLPPQKNVSLADLLICGHLKGGGREEQNAFRPAHYHHHQHDQHLHQQQQVWLEAAAHGVVHALRVVARLASGLAYDADSHWNEPTPVEDDENDNDNHNKARHRRRHHHHHHQRMPPYQDDESSEDGSESTRCDDGDDDSTTTSSLSMPPVLELPTDLDLSNMDLPTDVLSVSSLAEAYYAHQAAMDFDVRSHCPYYWAGGTTAAGAAATNNNSQQQQYGHRLDYVITQSDIARMARNAARHLDVESIYNLPTTTYRSKKTQTTTSTTTTTTPPAAATATATTSTKIELPHHKPPQHTIGKDAIEGFSWLIIPEESSVDDHATTIVPEGETEREEIDPSISAAQEIIEEEGEDEQTDDDDDEGKDVCVICCEQFCDGDRLRVLPCQHSFHMGCIDRWLSGSHSTLDCVTSGCPTCKKRPNSDKQIHHHHHHHIADEEQLNGSVPAWVFAQIGESLASASQRDHQQLTTTTTTTTSL